MSWTWDTLHFYTDFYTDSTLIQGGESRADCRFELRVDDQTLFYHILSSLMMVP